MKTVLVVLSISLCLSSVIALNARVNTGGDSLNVRNGPSSRNAFIGTIYAGQNFDVDCQVTGETISGNSGTTNVWLHVPSKGGYVSAAFVNTFGNGAPQCGGPVRVNTRGSDTLNVRSGPTTRHSWVGSLSAGQEFTVDCQVNGDNVSGESGTTNVWYHVPSKGGYVSAAFVNSGGRGFPQCSSPAPSGGDCSQGLRNPRNCAEAVAWAEAHLTNSYNAEYRGLCDHFVGLAYGRSASGFDTAMVHWETTPAQFKHYDRNPPAGALCFFRTSAAGHATICTGGEGIISTDINGPGTLGRTSISGIEAKWGAPFLGWTAPYFHNA